jgi:serine/threonine protein kinase
VAIRNTDDLIGVVFDDRYEVTGLVGQGGMATVYKAIHRRLDKVVALKVMSREVTYEDKQIKRFTLEAKACSKLQHPNIVRVFDYGQSAQGLFYIAMELLDGPNLALVIKKDFPISGERACLIMKQVCDALQEAHSQGIIHRDLKPENIILSDVAGKKDFVKILDFGIAKVVNENSSETLTQTGYICGTPLYISPEQSLGKPLDGRADLYSAGVIMFELLTGRQPFVADSAIALVMKHIHDEPPRVRAIYPEVKISDQLEEYIYRLLRKDRDKRPKDAEEVASDLLRLSTLPPREGVVSADFLPTAEEVGEGLNQASTMAIEAPVGSETVVAKKEAGLESDVDKTLIHQVVQDTVPTTLDKSQDFNAEATMAISSEKIVSTAATMTAAGSDPTVVFDAEAVDATVAIEVPPQITDRVAIAAIQQGARTSVLIWALIILVIIGTGIISMMDDFEQGESQPRGIDPAMIAAQEIKKSPQDSNKSSQDDPAAELRVRGVETTAARSGRRALEPVSVSGGPHILTPPAELEIRIETVPSRARVVVRDKRVGLTPFVFRAGPDTPETSVIVMRRGYYPQTWLYKPTSAWAPGQDKVKLVLKKEPKGTGGGGIKWTE